MVIHYANAGDKQYEAGCKSSVLCIYFCHTAVSNMELTVFRYKIDNSFPSEKYLF